MRMSQPDPNLANSKTNPKQNISLAASQEMSRQSMKAFEAVIESITPWLVEFGTWVFAGLIGFALIVIAPLVTVGPVESAILISTVALALTLPLNLAGLLLLRLVQDAQRYEDKLAEGFHNASLILGSELASPLRTYPLQKRRTEIVLLVSLGLLVVSALLTLVGLVAALWHVAWWIGILFLIMTIISMGIVITAFSAVRPPQSQEEREQRQRYAEEMIRRAEEQVHKNEVRTEPPH
jgi:MFS family permease